MNSCVQYGHLFQDVYLWGRRAVGFCVLQASNHRSLLVGLRVATVTTSAQLCMFSLVWTWKEFIWLQACTRIYAVQHSNSRRAPSSAHQFPYVISLIWDLYTRWAVCITVSSCSYRRARMPNYPCIINWKYFFSIKETGTCQGEEFALSVR